MKIRYCKFQVIPFSFDSLTLFCMVWGKAVVKLQFRPLYYAQKLKTAATVLLPGPT